MVKKIRHRGPDGEGFWNNDARTQWLGHCRLSIFDRSKAASQPFHYLHYTIIFNGAIYNFPELKKELYKFGYRFTTRADTEIIPAAYDHWGIDCLHKFDGMFAFVLVDHRNNKALAVRDRFGEKPLFYHTDRNVFGSGRIDRLLIASEMKALWEAQTPFGVNEPMVMNYLTEGFVQNPADLSETFFNEVYRVLPGHWLDIDLHRVDFKIRQWYNPMERIMAAGPALGNEADLIEQYRHLFFKSVTDRLRADVPVGTSLSGGLDSSSILAAIDDTKKRVKLPNAWSNVCFSAVFTGFAKDEGKWSEIVSNAFGVYRYALEPCGLDLMSTIEEFMDAQEEPVHSTSAFVQFMIYRAAAKEGITVMLDGQGADEVLGGYAKYGHWYLQQLLHESFATFRHEKRLLKKHGMLEKWGPANYLAAWMPDLTARKLRKRAMNRQWNAPVLDPQFKQRYFEGEPFTKPSIRKLEDLLFYNTFHHGLEELLRYADRNSMANGCEVRLPYLQHDLVEFAFRLPSNFKIRDGFGKWVLRKAMEPYLPPRVAWRTDKIGFEPPQSAWLRNAQAQDWIKRSRFYLSRRYIVNLDFVDQPLVHTAANDPNSYDWRILSVNLLYNPRKY